MPQRCIYSCKSYLSVFINLYTSLRNRYIFNLQRNLNLNVLRMLVKVAKQGYNLSPSRLYLQLVFLLSEFFLKVRLPTVYFCTAKELEKSSLWNWSVILNHYIQFSYCPMIYLFWKWKKKPKQQHKKKNAVSVPTLSRDGLLLMLFIVTDTMLISIFKVSHTVES